MNIKEIRELLELIEKSAVEEFEMERAGVRIRVRKTLPHAAGQALPLAEAQNQPVPAPRAEAAAEAEEPTESLYLFKAPIVGTFYLSPKPDAEPFVSPGDHVEKGTVLCIIEAMKIFNQIESDVKGEIVKILVENGQPVEYGEPLFQIRLHS